MGCLIGGWWRGDGDTTRVVRARNLETNNTEPSPDRNKRYRSSTGVPYWPWTGMEECFNASNMLASNI